ncbi:Hrd protein [Salix suchowensis]|nr:Hrd protein [Salix suchowensis]
MIELPSGEWVPIVRNKKFTIPASPLSRRKSTVPRSPPSAPYAFGPRGVVRSSRLDTTPTRASPSEKSTPLLTSEEPAEDAAPPLPLVSPLPADTVDPGLHRTPWSQNSSTWSQKNPLPQTLLSRTPSKNHSLQTSLSQTTPQTPPQKLPQNPSSETLSGNPSLQNPLSQTQHTYYSNLQLGTGWMGLLKAFQRVEAANDYFDPPGRISLATGNRPLEVKWWISRGRKYTVSIERPVDDYAEQWWAGGTASNLRAPLVRPEGVQDVPQVADWTALDKPGVNGFLTVVATLAWWGAKLKEEKHATQLERLEDDQLEGRRRTQLRMWNTVESKVLQRSIKPVITTETPLVTVRLGLGCWKIAPVYHTKKHIDRQFAKAECTFSLYLRAGSTPWNLGYTLSAQTSLHPLNRAPQRPNCPKPPLMAPRGRKRIHLTEEDKRSASRAKKRRHYEK